MRDEEWSKSAQCSMNKQIAGTDQERRFYAMVAGLGREAESECLRCHRTRPVLA